MERCQPQFQVNPGSEPRTGLQECPTRRSFIAKWLTLRRFWKLQADYPMVFLRMPPDSAGFHLRSGAKSTSAAIAKSVSIRGATFPSHGTRYSRHKPRSTGLRGVRMIPDMYSHQIRKY